MFWIIYWITIGISLIMFFIGLFIGINGDRLLNLNTIFDDKENYLFTLLFSLLCFIPVFNINWGIWVIYIMNQSKKECEQYLTKKIMDELMGE